MNCAMELFLEVNTIQFTLESERQHFFDRDIRYNWIQLTCIAWNFMITSITSSSCPSWMT